jgi:superfamily II DNA/RNA helicase
VKLCPRDRQTLFFSATLDGEAGRIAAAYTTDPARHEHKPKVDPAKAALVEHRFLSVEHEHKLKVLVDELRQKRDLALVFVRTKRGADRLVKRLGREGIDAVAMHGDKTQGQRERALAQFEAFKVDVLVATDVAARGIDVNGVSHVINFDPPEDREGYVHRVGRTGRAGRRGVGITFVMHDQAKDVAAIAGALKLHDEFAKAGVGGGRSHAQHQPRPKSRTGKGHTGPSERKKTGPGFKGGSYGSTRAGGSRRRSSR